MRARGLLELAGERCAPSATRRPTAARRRRRRARRARRRGRATPRRRPAAASGSASRHALVDAEVLEALEQRVLGVGGVERVERGAARGACRSPRRCSPTSSAASLALDAGLDERGAASVDRVAGPRRSARPRGARPRAGLLSSCASPAAIVPERGQPLAVLLDRGDRGSSTRPRPAPMTRRCTAGCANARRRKSSGGMQRDAARRSRRCSRTRSGSSVSAAIAPIQVGACWRPIGSTRSPVDRERPDRALEQQQQPGRLAPCSASDVARRDVARSRDRAPTRRAASSSSSSKRSIGRRSARVTAGRLIRRPGTGG